MTRSSSGKMKKIKAGPINQKNVQSRQVYKPPCHKWRGGDKGAQQPCIALGVAPVRERELGGRTGIEARRLRRWRGRCGRHVLRLLHKSIYWLTSPAFFYIIAQPVKLILSASCIFGVQFLPRTRRRLGTPGERRRSMSEVLIEREQQPGGAYAASVTASPDLALYAGKFVGAAPPGSSSLPWPSP